MVLGELTRHPVTRQHMKTPAHKAEKSPKPASLYRTRWLIAHNALHDVIYALQGGKYPALSKRWRQYLKEQKTAPQVACKPA
jgi:hypothetical protein